jgi:Holliday junction resolvase RusA-like endonuclease
VAFAKKFIQDSLVRAGVLKDDGWREIESFEDVFKVDKRNPRVEIEIKRRGVSGK